MDKYAIIFGGESYEHEISIVSAITIKGIVNSDLVFIFCNDEHRFYLVDRDKMRAKYFSSGDYKKDSEEIYLKKGGFYKKSLLKEKRVEFDKAINLIHGKDGEDGVMASLLDFFGVEYIGPRVEASVISYNKELTKLYANSKGVEVLPYQVIQKDEDQKITLSFPLIIKPLRLGSSIGLSVVESENDLEYALDVAFEFDDTVLVEPFYKDIKEYNIAGIKTKEGFIHSIIEEPFKKGFLDFDKKYLDFSSSQTRKEANLEESVKEDIVNAFDKIYSNVFEGAIIRCDFFLMDGKVYLNEINPIPGSLANYLFSDFSDVLDKISKNLPRKREIRADYRYINSINAAKCK
jgi:D-alanine-D-alanine ligase